MSSQLKSRYTVTEYLVLERKVSYKNEYTKIEV